MSYRLHAGEPIEAGLRRVALDQLGRAREELDDPGLDLHASVHQVRKRCKKLRGLLRLVRPGLEGDTYRRENAALRDAQRSLSTLRDAGAYLETVDALLEAFRGEVDTRAFAPVREALSARRRSAGDADPQQTRLYHFRRALDEARERVHTWRLEKEGFDALGAGLARTYRRGRRAMADAYAEGGAEAFHAWRKRAKYHLLHVRLLREAWRSGLEPRRRALDRLAELLGDEHDLAVLSALLRERPVEALDPRTGEALRGLIAARRARLRRQALPLGRRLFADRPKALAHRLGVWFDVAWSDEEESGAPARTGPGIAVAP